MPPWRFPKSIFPDRRWGLPTRTPDGAKVERRSRGNVGRNPCNRCPKEDHIPGDEHQGAGSQDASRRANIQKGIRPARVIHGGNVHGGRMSINVDRNIISVQQPRYVDGSVMSPANRPPPASSLPLRSGAARESNRQSPDQRVAGRQFDAGHVHGQTFEFGPQRQSEQRRLHVKSREPPRAPRAFLVAVF